jgi:hypothetical protein
VQIDYDVVHLRTSLVKLFVLLQLNFEEVIQIIELRRFGGAPKGYPFAALRSAAALLLIWVIWKNRMVGCPGAVSARLHTPKTLGAPPLLCNYAFACPPPAAALLRRSVPAM